jgi:hypothetical protein
MARYNTVLSANTSTVTAGTTIGTPLSGTFTTISGTAGTVTLPDPAQFSGVVQTFYNITGGAVTLTATGGSNFAGPGGSGTSTQLLPNGGVVTLASDGAKYILMFDGGTGVTATTGTFTDATDSTTNATGSVQLPGGLAVNKNITIGKAGTNTGLLRIEGATSGTFVQKAAATTTGYTVTWPAAVTSTANYGLVSDTNGILSWAQTTPTVTATTTAGTYYPMFSASNSGALGTANVSTAGLTFDPSTSILTVAGTVKDIITETIKTGDYTLSAADRGLIITFNNTSTATVTVPTFAAASIPVGSKYIIHRLNTGAVNLVAAGGVTVGVTGQMAQYEVIQLWQRTQDNWIVQQALQGNTLSTSNMATSISGGYTLLTASSAGSYSLSF